MDRVNRLKKELKEKVGNIEVEVEYDREKDCIVVGNKGYR